jgi:hypothetical protein
MKQWFAGLAFVLFVAGTAEGATITTQSALSHVDQLGTTQAEQSVAATDGSASSVAIWPAGTSPVQARTAARSRAAEIAANARVSSDGFAATQLFDIALSQATYTVQLDPLVAPTDVSIDFFLPPSYVEIVQNAETSFNVLETTFLADLRVCFDSVCSASDRVFSLQTDLRGDYRDLRHGVQLEAHPSLDVSPLLDPLVSDSGRGGFNRTYLVAFPEFIGHVELGRMPVGLPLRVEYILQARASGRVALSSAIAAVNDPFTVDTDAVQPGAPLVVTATPVPEPATALLLACGLAGLGRVAPATRSCRRRGGAARRSAGRSGGRA